jgi:hypothetical protein
MAHARIPESGSTRSRGRTARLIAVLAGVLVLGFATFVGSSPDRALAASPSGPASPEQCAHLGTCAPAPSTSASQSSSPSAGCSGGGGSSIWSDIGGLLKGAAGLATGNAASLAGPITHGVISSLFQWPSCSNGAGTWLVKSLVATPNYTQQGTNLSQVGKNTSAIGLGLLGATITFAIIQFWLSGIMSMGGGFAGAEGIARGVGAGVLIALWPWAFGQFVAASNTLSGAVVSSGMQARIGKLILGALALPGLNSVALIVMVILALLGLVLLIGLLLLKMAIGATLAVIYVAMPILLALGVVPTFAWLPRLAAKALLTILLIPLIWAVIFAVFSAFALDSLTFGNFTYQGAGFWGTILRPLASLVLLVLMIKLPMQLARLASLSALIPGASRGGGGGVRGMASRAGSVAMGTAVGGAVRSQLPSSMGGQRPEMHYTRDAEGGAHVHRDSPPSMRRVRANSAEASGVRDEVEQERLRKKQEHDGSKQNGGGRQDGRESSQQGRGSAETQGQRNGQGTAGDPFAGGYTFGTNGQAAGSAAAGAAGGSRECRRAGGRRGRRERRRGDRGRRGAVRGQPDKPRRRIPE